MMTIKDQVALERTQAAGQALREIYRALDAQLAGEGLACVAGCHVCCTDRVALTMAEARLVLEGLATAGLADLAGARASMAVDPQARPHTSTNQVAAMIIQGQEPPEEPQAAVGPGVCPLLDATGLCRVYEHRPLACRIMVSRRRCAPDGSAEMSDWLVTLGLAFAQLVEHCSAGEPYGLLADVLAVAQGQARPVLQCQRLPGLPAPPEHQDRLQQVVRAVMARPCRQGLPLGLWLERLGR